MAQETDEVKVVAGGVTEWSHPSFLCLSKFLILLFHLNVPLPLISLLMLFFHPRLFFPNLLPRLIFTPLLQLPLSLFFPSAIVSALRLKHSTYSYVSTGSFFSLLYTQSPSLSLISSSLSHVVLNHYSSACKAQKCTCPPMVRAWVQALKYGCESDILESLAADPIYFKRYPWCLVECLKTEALIFWSTAFCLLYSACFGFYYNRNGLAFDIQTQIISTCNKKHFF